MSLQQSDVNTLINLVPSISEYENAIKVQRSYSKIKFKKSLNEEAKLSQIEEQKNIEGRYEDLAGEYCRGKKNPKWNTATINKIIYETENNTGNSYSAILVELIDSNDNEKYYLEIEAILTNKGWKIFDDIMIVEDNIEKRINEKNKRGN
ncbi:hypothetical protein [Flavobacterium sp. HJJ]|uniref:hypothetical protein n=1 Tax=Flavobacterium sp. HJJ TaxID=2783792 RepID=UPI00188C986A|nr:hypothetical protein [Flavobacterium sp. HJJ]MBF4471081.1 hypothetical protein [Flavobacterium sp. HJJ]